ncbi:MAG: DUF4190 domain-containing protein [Chloracidobacterium sp.]|uniref:DUF4190 domain-containing protein n=1 Tax=Chloracidobacterium validum TaxID=2821543 RepID=A0ABX8BDL7_9BACT|nr:DUF4190 domain-containing protein [Chloracidobacterium validum]QUW03970.1 DUF4190 domain-containing protein [Chloracidobacterium validum]
MPYYCPNCGALNADTVAVCHNCGAPNPSAPVTDTTPAAATNPFEAPTQPQSQPASPYQAPSYPPPVPPGAYGTPPTIPYQYPPPPPMAAYVPPSYGQVGYQEATLFAESGRLQSQARTALILGILGLLCCGLLGPIAMGFGFQSKSKLQRIGVTEGQGMALAGIILGGAATALWFLGMLVSLISG